MDNVSTRISTCIEAKRAAALCFIYDYLAAELDPEGGLYKLIAKTLQRITQHAVRARYERELKAFVLRSLEYSKSIEVDYSEHTPQELWEKKLTIWGERAARWNLKMLKISRHCTNDSGYCWAIVLKLNN